MNDLSLFHSFPRLRTGESLEDQIAKGLRILKLVVKLGLVLAPEVINWKQPLKDGSTRELQQLQKRICFTELAEAQLQDHGKRFGPFAIEFDLGSLRRLGVIPVSYLPQTLDSPGASAVAATIVAGLLDARYTVDRLWNLHERMSTVSDSPIDLENTDSSGAVVRRYRIPCADLKGVLEYLSFRNAPFDLTRGALNAMLSLYYPSDNQVTDQVLGYYRQREWRIVSGIVAGGLPLSFKLSAQESAEVADSDRDFWDRTLSIDVPQKDARTFRRIEEAERISKINGQPVVGLIKSIIVPESAIASASEVLDGTQIRTRALKIVPTS